MVKGKFDHVEWLDLNNDGVLTECAIMKTEPNGDVYFFPLTSLDNIDKRRLASIITRRDSHLYELWDLMSNITLGNGMNALTYFHQLVKVKTPQGKIITPSMGRRGQPGIMDTRTDEAKAEAKAKASKAKAE